jgi:hypothetical protein
MAGMTVPRGNDAGTTKHEGDRNASARGCDECQAKRRQNLVPSRVQGPEARGYGPDCAEYSARSGLNALKRWFQKPDAEALARLRTRVWQLLRSTPGIRVLGEAGTD